jgi:hypothetical protein
MHTIEPARRRPHPDGTAATEPIDPGVDTHLIRGRALIFWDPTSSVPRKLDAIDTDQITPAADCVSESLERLDERW